METRPSATERLAKVLARTAPRYFATRLKNPFFILGSARSGTSILAHTLASHSDIATYPGEANDIWHPQTYPWRYSKYRADVPPLWVNPEKFTRFSLIHRSNSEVRRIKSVFGAYQFIMAKKCFLNKSAMIAFMIPFILDEFPNARLIHLIRDGRAVTLSYARREHQKLNNSLNINREHNRDFSLEKTLRICAESWRHHIEEVKRQEKKLKLKSRGIILEVRYEDFCRSPRSSLVKIANFMGIDSSGFPGTSYSQIASRNYKYQEEVSESAVLELCQIMEPTLSQTGYL